MIPVVLVSGFLGAGKTTLINALLAQRKARIGVIVNDFGDINIDAMLLAGQVDQTIGLTNGCVCCRADDDDLEVALTKLARIGAGLDAIIVEASGLAEPRPLITRIVHHDDPALRYGGNLYVLDALQAAHPVPGYLEDVARHLRYADIVLITKADVADPAGAHLLIDEHCPEAARVLGGAALDLELLFDRGGDGGGGGDRGGVDSARAAESVDEPEQLTLDDLFASASASPAGSDRPGGAREPLGIVEQHPHHRYAALTLRADGPLHPRRLADFLEHPSPGVFRVKGAARVGGASIRATFVIHTAGHFVRVERPRRGQAVPAGALLTVIGTGLDVDAITARFAACSEPWDGADEFAMASITRFLGG